MTQTPSKRPVRRGRIFPELTISPEEQARQEAENKAFNQRSRPIFERVRPQLIENHYNWFIVIEPDSEEYFIDSNHIAAVQKARDKYPQGEFFTFRLNETGACGKI